VLPRISRFKDENTMHPFAKKGGHAARRAKARKLAAGGCAGSDKMPFSSAGIESRRSRKGPDESDMLAAGHKGAKRFARGGKIKKPAHQTNIAIVVPHHAGAPSGIMGPMDGPPAAMGGPPPMPPGTGMMPPGAGMPPGPPPGMPMRARGGRAGLPDAGAASGVGREEKASVAKRNR
jgi:hypothetical protein